MLKLVTVRRPPFLRPHYGTQQAFPPAAFTFSGKEGQAVIDYQEELDRYLEQIGELAHNTLRVVGIL